MAPRLINPLELIDADQVADLLGLVSQRVVSVYRSRYPDFPEPLIQRASGRCLLWYRPEILQWRARHPALTRRAEPGDNIHERE